jgi:D-psicose/D-tagatose/L-ribulose 3-epimerase
VRIALCNEVLSAMEFADQCRYARTLGYDGLEVAPYTFAEDPAELSDVQCAAIRHIAQEEGIAICGLHWLLVKPGGLSITSPDHAIRRRTVEVMTRLVEVCALLGGSYLVHGSPGQRAIPPGETGEVALARAKKCWAAAGEAAGKHGVTYCIEPLSADQTPLVNTVAEAAAIVDGLNLRALATMLDTSSAALTERESIPALIDRFVPSGHIRHVQLNDRNRMGPGQGEDRFAPVLAALLRTRYAGVVAIEPFKYEPDGPGAAARAIGYLHGILEALEFSR